MVDEPFHYLFNANLRDSCFVRMLPWRPIVVYVFGQSIKITIRVSITAHMISFFHLDFYTCIKDFILVKKITSMYALCLQGGYRYSPLPVM